MMTEMLKQVSLSIFGLGLGVAVLAANTDPAMADRGKTYWIDGLPRASNEVTVIKRKSKAAQTANAKGKFQNNLDFETEAVWRNLRPNRFTD